LIEFQQQKRKMTNEPFANLPHTAAEHFRLCFYAAVLRVIENVAIALGSFETAFEQFPFLVGYNNELAMQGAGGMSSDEAGRWWRESLLTWEAKAEARLPLRELREAAGLDYSSLLLWITVGLIEEDARFGSLFAAMQGTPEQHRPTAGLLNAWWSSSDEERRPDARRLAESGLIQVVNPNAPRVEWALQAHMPLWEAATGSKSAWGDYLPQEQLPALDELIMNDGLRAQLARLPRLMADGAVRALIVRGPEHNGRRTVIGAVARALGRGLLAVRAPNRPDSNNLPGPLNDERWKLAGPMATLLGAMPVVLCEPAPGETIELPPLLNYAGPLGVVMNRQGGVAGECVERALTLTLEMPCARERALHWHAALDGAGDPSEIEAISDRFRLTGGNIRRAAKLATTHARLQGRDNPALDDVREACQALNRQSLETLATRVKTGGDWGHLAVSSQTRSELTQLESRCRRREQLQSEVGVALRGQLNAGVRALFTGPSGAGKTLAARLLASELKMDLYRVDLSSVVNKYIGETEKNLNRLFARAEELDVILLLDEGDALLTQRTNVQSSNDRYANLETNYLLQRLESFDGVIIITTNAADRIDGAFQRRMDVVIDFRAPDAYERWTIWRLHLPENHQVAEDRLNEIAGRCVLTGGQVRNVALHASLLALGNGGIVTTAHLESALQREYRKTGEVCPIRMQ
jgi:hypothetical protein